jgi:hypothetical protein
MHAFCDGCASQYKSRHCLGDLSNSFREFGYSGIGLYSRGSVRGIVSKNPPLTAVRLLLDEIFITKIKEILC